VILEFSVRIKFSPWSGFSVVFQFLDFRNLFKFSCLGFSLLSIERKETGSLPFNADGGLGLGLAWKWCENTIKLGVLLGISKGCF
jgi:hypothetical protein